MWKEKLQKKDDLMERLKTPPGGWSRTMQMKMEAPQAIHTPGGTPATGKPATMIEGEFDPPAGSVAEEDGGEGDGGGGGAGGGGLAKSVSVSLPNLRVDTRKTEAVGGGGKGRGRGLPEEPFSPD